MKNLLQKLLIASLKRYIQNIKLSIFYENFWMSFNNVSSCDPKNVENMCCKKRINESVFTKSYKYTSIYLLWEQKDIFRKKVGVCWHYYKFSLTIC
jgi:hypothetical protein